MQQLSNFQTFLFISGVILVIISIIMAIAIYRVEKSNRREMVSENNKHKTKYTTEERQVIWDKINELNPHDSTWE